MELRVPPDECLAVLDFGRIVLNGKEGRSLSYFRIRVEDLLDLGCCRIEPGPNISI